jgi:hypothetical protein
MAYGHGANLELTEGSIALRRGMAVISCSATQMGEYEPCKVPLTAQKAAARNERRTNCERKNSWDVAKRAAVLRLISECNSSEPDKASSSLPVQDRYCRSTGLAETVLHFNHSNHDNGAERGLQFVDA